MRRVFYWIAASIIVTIALLIVTALVRLAFIYAWGVITLGIPAIGQSVWADPWLILAFIVAALLAWSRPWENLNVPQEEVPRRGPKLERWGRHTSDDE